MNKKFRLVFLVSLLLLMALSFKAFAAPFAYITNYNDNVVSVIDTNTNTVIDTVAVGFFPYGVAVNSSGTRVYVANWGSGNVSVINTNTNTVDTTISVGIWPTGIAINSLGNRVYVANNGTNNVSVIDTNTNIVDTTISVGSGPVGIAINSLGSRVYVANFGSGNVSVINTNTNTVDTTITVETGPYGVAVNPSGTRIYVTNYYGGNVSVIDTNTNAVIATIPAGSFPYGVAVNRSGTSAYVAYSGNVLVIDTITNTVIDTVAVGTNPVGIAINPLGTRVYVANKFSNNVSVIDTNTNTVIDTVAVGNGPSAFGQFIGPDTGLKISAGYEHNLGIKSDGTLWAWGWNYFGQLGDSTNTDKNYPMQIQNDSNWVSISAGFASCLGIKSDGTLWAWGDNEYGQLGDSTNTDKNYPIQIGSENNWVSISTCLHSLGIKSDGTLWAWGVNTEGELGDSTNGFSTNKNYPIRIGSDSNWASISAGGGHSLGIKSDGTLWAWGLNDHGQLGDSTIGYITNYPIQVGSDSNWASIYAGQVHSLGMKSDGTLWAWGGNLNGQLGDSTNTDKNYPIQIGIDGNWVPIMTGYYHSLGLKSDGTLLAWGSNWQGELGDSTNTSKNYPIQTGSDSNWVSISAGQFHSLGIKSDGTLWAWGDNYYGELGNSTYTDTNYPVQVIGFGASQNQSPTVSLNANLFSGTAPLTVNFTANAYDTDGVLAKYEWDFDGNGGYDTFTTGNTRAYTYNSAGVFSAKVRVTDDDGATDEDKTTVTVNNNGGAISGRITDGTNGIQNVNVRVYNMYGNWAGNVLTDSSGYYTVNDLSSGIYEVMFDCSDLGYIGKWYNGKSNLNSADTVFVTAPATTSGIDAVLESGGVISGRVTDGTNNGIQNVSVIAYVSNGEEISWGETDAEGNYTVKGITTGNYKVQFWGIDAGYVNKWYNNKTDMESAETVFVTAPDTTGGVNAVLESGGSISGRVTDGTNGIPYISIGVYDTSGNYISEDETDAGGNYTARGIPTGNFKVEFGGSEEGYLSEWYNNKADIGSANTISVTAPDTTSGINAVLASIKYSDYLPTDSTTFGLRTFEWTYGTTGQYTSSIEGEVTVPYTSGGITGAKITNFDPEGDAIVFNDGNNVKILGWSEYYFSSDSTLSGHSSAWSFNTFRDNQIIDQTYYAVKNDFSEIDGSGNQKILIGIQDVNIGGVNYNNAIIMWYLDLDEVFKPLNFQGRESTLGIELPTGSETEGYAVTGFSIYGFGTGPICTGDIGSVAGSLVSLVELISITNPNIPPAVTLSANLNSGNAPLTVNFTANAYDTDGVIASYEWDFDGNGVYDTLTTGNTGAYTYNSAGVYNAKVRVTDNDSATAIDSTIINVLQPNYPPVVSLNVNYDTGIAPLIVNFTANAYDTDGVVAKYDWDFDGNGVYDSTTNNNTVSYTFNTNGSWQVNVRVTDNNGATRDSSINITVNRPQANLPLGNLDIASPGSINRIDGYDLFVLSMAFGSRPGDPNWNISADLDGNNIVDGNDLILLAANFGKRN